MSMSVFRMKLTHTSSRDCNRHCSACDDARLAQRLRGVQRGAAAAVQLVHKNVVRVDAREALLELGDDGSDNLPHVKPFSKQKLGLHNARQLDKQWNGPAGHLHSTLGER